MTNEELAIRIKAGETELMAELWNNTERLISKLIQCYSLTCKLSTTVSMEDLKQECYFALAKAVNYFDESKGLKFTTYLGYNLTNACREALRYRSTKQQREANNYRTTSLNYQIVSDSGSIGELIDNIESTEAADQLENVFKGWHNEHLSAVIAECLEEIPSDCRQAINLKYYQDLSYDEIGKAVGCTGNRAQQLVVRGLYNMRKPHIVKRLREIETETYELAYSANGYGAYKNRGYISRPEQIVLLLDSLKENKEVAYCE